MITVFNARFMDTNIILFYADKNENVLVEHDPFANSNRHESLEGALNYLETKGYNIISILPDNRYRDCLLVITRH